MAFSLSLSLRFAPAAPALLLMACSWSLAACGGGAGGTPARATSEAGAGFSSTAVTGGSGQESGGRAADGGGSFGGSATNGGSGTHESIGSGGMIGSGGLGGTGGAASSGGGIANPPGPVLLEFDSTQALSVSQEDADHYDFPALLLGEASSDRAIIVAVHAASNDIVSFDSVTIGSVTATKVIGVGEDVAPSAPSALFAARVVTGTTANIHVQLSTIVVRCAVAVYTVYGLTSLQPFDAKTMVSLDPSSLSINIAAGGFVIGALAMAGDERYGLRWTGETHETYNTVLVESSGTPTLISGIVVTPVPTAETHVVSLTHSGIDFAYNARWLAASFR